MNTAIKILHTEGSNILGNVQEALYEACALLSALGSYVTELETLGNMEFVASDRAARICRRCLLLVDSANLAVAEVDSRQRDGGSDDPKANSTTANSGEVST